MEVMELLTQAVEQNAADIFLVPGMPFSYKIGGAEFSTSNILCSPTSLSSPS